MEVTANSSILGIKLMNIFADAGTHMAFKTEGVERMRISANGNVGIGTTAPSSKFNVNGTVRVGLLTNDNGSTSGYGDAIYFSGGDDWGSYDSDNSDGLWIARYNVASDQSELRVSIGDDDGGVATEVDKFTIGAYDGSGIWRHRMTVLSSGNVGIGTTSPNYKLHINPENGLGLKIARSGGSRLLLRNEFGGVNRKSWGIGVGGVPTGGAVPFQISTIADDETIVSTPLTITQGGNVSIDGKLTVSGGVDPPYISFSDESHESIRGFAKDVEEHEKAMQFWNSKAHRMEIYVIEEDIFYTITGELIKHRFSQVFKSS